MNQLGIAALAFSILGLVLLTMFVTWVAYSTVRMLQRHDARDAGRASGSPASARVTSPR